MREAVQGNIKEYDPNMRSDEGSRVKRLSCGDASMMATAPSYTGAAMTVARVSNISASDFYRRFARRGLPAVLDGGVASAVTPEHVAALAECLANEYASKAAAHGYTSRADCDRYNGWCRDGVQISSDPRCKRLAGFSAEDLPPRLSALVSVPRPLPSVVEATDRMAEPFLLWTPPGGTFGSSNHFDQLCANTLSFQFQGSKHWTLWAPWDVPAADSADQRAVTDAERDCANGVRAHTRFETVVKPGDVLYYPPAWFHATVVRAGVDSITSASELERYPAFGALAGRTMGQEPLGFGACEDDWREKSELWDRVLLS